MRRTPTDLWSALVARWARPAQPVVAAATWPVARAAVAPAADPTRAEALHTETDRVAVRRNLAVVQR